MACLPYSPRFPSDNSYEILVTFLRYILNYLQRLFHDIIIEQIIKHKSNIIIESFLIKALTYLM